jgi:hypothetical protein
LIQPWYLAAQKHENTALKKAPREWILTSSKTLWKVYSWQMWNTAVC